jgi:hypothetical protein
LALRLDAHPQVVGRLDLGRRALREGNRTLLLGKAVGKRRRGRDALLELGPAIRRQRSVRQRGELGDLLAAYFVSWAPSQGHATPNGSSLPRESDEFIDVDRNTITSSRTP